MTENDLSYLSDAALQAHIELTRRELLKAQSEWSNRLNKRLRRRQDFESIMESIEQDKAAKARKVRSARAALKELLRDDPVVTAPKRAKRVVFSGRGAHGIIIGEHGYSAAPRGFRRVWRNVVWYGFCGPCGKLPQ
jgi:hypothetical protein